MTSIWNMFKGVGAVDRKTDLYTADKNRVWSVAS